MTREHGLRVTSRNHHGDTPPIEWPMMLGR
jgi:hypothetical protein